MIEFRPMTPDEGLYSRRGHRPDYGDYLPMLRPLAMGRLTIEIPEGAVLCTIALDEEVAAAVEVLLAPGREGERPIGMSGRLFRACPIGPDPAHRGGAVPLARGPATFEVWLRNLANAPVPARAVAGMSVIGTVSERPQAPKSPK